MDNGRVPKSQVNCIPPRTTRKSDSPRGSKRNMVGNQSRRLLFRFRREHLVVMKRRNFSTPDQQIVLTEQGLAAMKSISSRRPVGGEMFFLTAPFREHWVTFEEQLEFRLL